MEFRLNTIKTPKRKYYLVDPQYGEKFKEVTQEIQNKYSIKMPNRDLIIKSLIVTIVHGDYIDFKVPNINLAVIRSDIKNFYPSINKHQLYQKINTSNVLSFESLGILKKFLLNSKYEGIPLGLPFSNHLAEFYVENLDKKINLLLEPIIYFRYIDDFIFIKYCDYLNVNDRNLYAKSMKCNIKQVLEENKLNINEEKTITSFYLFNSKERDKKEELNFTYLGYHFSTEDGKLIVEISNKKLRKYSARLNQYFFEYKKGKRRNIDFWRLYYKILNELHGITSINKKNYKMKSGLAYHYRYVNSYKNLNVFIKHFKEIIISLKLNSSKTHLLLNLFSDKNDELIFMQKRFNYLKLTSKQRENICKRLGILKPELDPKRFVKKVFWSLYN